MVDSASWGTQPPRVIRPRRCGRVLVEDAADNKTYSSLDTTGVLGSDSCENYLGAAVAVGDFDADGYDDLAMSTPVSMRPGRSTSCMPAPVDSPASAFSSTRAELAWATPPKSGSLRGCAGGGSLQRRLLLGPGDWCSRRGCVGTGRCRPRSLAAWGHGGSGPGQRRVRVRVLNAALLTANYGDLEQLTTLAAVRIARSTTP